MKKLGKKVGILKESVEAYCDCSSCSCSSCPCGCSGACGCTSYDTSYFNTGAEMNRRTGSDNQTGANNHNWTYSAIGKNL